MIFVQLFNRSTESCNLLIVNYLKICECTNGQCEAYFCKIILGCQLPYYFLGWTQHFMAKNDMTKTLTKKRTTDISIVLFSLFCFSILLLSVTPESPISFLGF